MVIRIGNKNSLKLSGGKFVLARMANLLRGYNRKPVDIDGREFLSHVWPLTSAIRELASVIFGAKLKSALRGAAEERALWLIGYVGFSKDFGASEQANVFLALANRFDEVQNLINCPKNKIKRPYFALTDGAPRVIKTERDDIFLIMIRRSSARNIMLIEEDVLAALRAGNK